MVVNESHESFAIARDRGSQGPTVSRASEALAAAGLDRGQSSVPMECGRSAGRRKLSQGLRHQRWVTIRIA